MAALESSKMFLFERREGLPPLTKMFLENKGLRFVRDGEDVASSQKPSLFKIQFRGEIETNPKNIISESSLIDSKFLLNSEYEEVAPDLYSNQTTVDFVTNCFKTHSNEIITKNVGNLSEKRRVKILQNIDDCGGSVNKESLKCDEDLVITKPEEYPQVPCVGNHKTVEYYGNYRRANRISNFFGQNNQDETINEKNGIAQLFEQNEKQIDAEHNYETVEPIYEEIPNSIPTSSDFSQNIKKDDEIVSIFAGATKYDILNYLVCAKERCAIPTAEEFVELGNSPAAVIELYRPEDDCKHARQTSNASDSCDESNNKIDIKRKSVAIERNDSGVGSETSKCSRSKWQQKVSQDENHTCEDCDKPVESITHTNTSQFIPMVCRKCHKKRVERREIITEIVETEEKYGRDLRITLENFYRPMLIAGLLTADQLSAIFLNIEELIENNALLAEKLRDAYEIAVEQGDEDLLTVNIGHIFIDCSSMLHAFESYCTRQGNAALILSNLEKEKELLSIFLRVSQMDNALLRRMNLNSFLMVPVQRVTKYPLLLARLHKVTSEHQVVQRNTLKEAQRSIELHLEHINSLTRDIGSTKLWRRISTINVRRSASEVDEMLNIKLQKAAIEVLEWCHEDVRFAMEGQLYYMHSIELRKNGKQIKMTPINALLVTLGKPSEHYTADPKDMMPFPSRLGIKEASLVLMKEKSGRYSLLREPIHLDRCIVYGDDSYEEVFEIQEIFSKDALVFKGEDKERTKKWCRILQYHCQGLGFWRKRRNALANIMINGMQIHT